MYIAGAKRPVDTGDTYFNELATSLGRQTLKGREVIKLKPVSSKPPLFARINHGRWLVNCPNCNNVEYAFEDNLLFCSQCSNGDGETRRVVISGERKQIEDILGKRLITNRHWNILETTDKLIAENIEYGIEEALI